jgi:hypothetical protein
VCIDQLTSVCIMTDEHESRFVAIGNNASIDVICNRRRAGDIPICPKCRADLLVAYTWEQANRYSIHPGIVCPTDAKHFQVLFNVQQKVE